MNTTSPSRSVASCVMPPVPPAPMPTPAPAVKTICNCGMANASPPSLITYPISNKTIRIPGANNALTLVIHVTNYQPTKDVSNVMNGARITYASMTITTQLSSVQPAVTSAMRVLIRH